MKIYLAELSHTGLGRSPNVAPLAAGYLAAVIGQTFPEAEISIFRDPNLLLRSVRQDLPEIVGFSVYTWSERLSSFCAEKVKEISKNTIVVCGGASIDSRDPELKRFLILNPQFDACIPNTSIGAPPKDSGF